MKVEHSGKVYLIEFAYYPAYPKGEHREGTACKILDGNAPRVEKQPAPEICRGTVRRHFKDPPNRDKGRKAALSRALAALDLAVPNSAETAREGTLRDKERRKLFWDVYLNRKKKQAHEAGKSGS